MIQRRLSDGMRIWLLAALCMVIALPALAGSGQPSPGQLGFQEAVTPIAEDIHWVHDYVNAIIFAITAFVLLLMLYVMWRFSEKRNPDALAHHAQHHDRGAVDGAAGADPGGDRHPLLPAALQAVHVPAAGRDHQGQSATPGTGRTSSPTRASASIR